jgi:hypothetical protein
MTRGSLTTTALLGLAVATALPQAGFAQSNPWIGTWNTNLAKSTFSPGPPPRGPQTFTFQTEGQGHRMTIEGIDAQGNPQKLVLTRIDDGKPHPITGNPAFDAEAFKTVNDSTVWIIRTKAGKVVSTTMSVMSADGKTFTDTITGVNANGQAFYNVAVREKQ